MKNVILYIKNNRIYAGSEYTVITALQTLRGINKRYNEHHRRMRVGGCSGFIVVPYYTWWAVDDVNELIEKCDVHRLED